MGQVAFTATLTNHQKNVIAGTDFSQMKMRKLTPNMTFGAVNFDYRAGRFHRKVDGLVGK